MKVKLRFRPEAYEVKHGWPSSIYIVYDFKDQVESWPCDNSMKEIVWRRLEFKRVDEYVFSVCLESSK